jgi:F-box and leucine-rich repeat protein GRR1
MKLRDYLNNAPEYEALREPWNPRLAPSSRHRPSMAPSAGALNGGLPTHGQLAGADGEFDEQEPDGADEDDGFEGLDGSEMALDTQPLLQGHPQQPEVPGMQPVGAATTQPSQPGLFGDISTQTPPLPQVNGGSNGGPNGGYMPVLPQFTNFITAGPSAPSASSTQGASFAGVGRGLGLTLQPTFNRATGTASTASMSRPAGTISPQSPPNPPNRPADPDVS